jgi:hypothetical protein
MKKQKKDKGKRRENEPEKSGLRESEQEARSGINRHTDL